MESRYQCAMNALSAALALTRWLRLGFGGPRIDPGGHHAGGPTFGLALDLVCRVAACSVRDPVRLSEIGTHEWVLGDGKAPSVRD